MKLSSSQLAQVCGVSSKTIRHYLDKGLLQASQRDANGYRYFNSGQVVTLLTIKYYQSLNLSLGDISALLAETTSQQDLLQQLTKMEQHVVKQRALLDEQLTLIRQVLEQQNANYASVHSALASQKYRPLFARLREHFADITDHAWQQLVQFDSQLLWTQEQLQLTDSQSPTFEQVVAHIVQEPRLKSLVTEIANRFFSAECDDVDWLLARFNALQHTMPTLAGQKGNWQLLLAQTLLELFDSQLTQQQKSLLQAVTKHHGGNQ